MLEELASQFQMDPHAVIVDASTKLALDWAELHRPVSEAQLKDAVSSLLRAFKKGLHGNQGLSQQAQSAVVKSAARLTSYWYMHNKSVDLENLAKVIEGFVGNLVSE